MVLCFPQLYKSYHLFNFHFRCNFKVLIAYVPDVKVAKFQYLCSTTAIFFGGFIQP